MYMYVHMYMYMCIYCAVTTTGIRNNSWYAVSFKFPHSDKKTGTMALICELMHMNIYELIKGTCICNVMYVHVYVLNMCQTTLFLFHTHSFVLTMWDVYCTQSTALIHMCMHTWAPTDRKSYLNEQRVKLYMYQLCKAVYHMHRNGIFHRDVKPENILITVGYASIIK